MKPVPKGYVALTSSRDGSTFLLDARGLTVTPSSGATTGANKLPTNCLVGPVADTDSYWFVAETFDEVCAKLAAALGEQDAPKPAAPAREVEPEDLVHHAEQLETARRALLNVPFAEPVRQAICAMDNAQATLRRIARGGA